MTPWKSICFFKVIPLDFRYPQQGVTLWKSRVEFSSNPLEIQGVILGDPLEIQGVILADPLEIQGVIMADPLEIHPFFQGGTPWKSDILNRGGTDYFWKSPFDVR